MTYEDVDQARRIYRAHVAVDLGGVPTCLACPDSPTWPCPELWGPLLVLLAEADFAFD